MKIQKLPLLMGAVCSIILIPQKSDGADSCLSPPYGLVSWWPGEGTAKDAMGRNAGQPLGGFTAKFQIFKELYSGAVTR